MQAIAVPIYIITSISSHIHKKIHLLIDIYTQINAHIQVAAVYIVVFGDIVLSEDPISGNKSFAKYINLITQKVTK